MVDITWADITYCIVVRDIPS